MANATPPDTTSPSPALDQGGSFMGHPKGLFLLFIVEMWERFSFYGMRAILGLYLACKTTGIEPIPTGEVAGFNPGRGWSEKDANNLMGWYGGMVYLLPILGGMIADRFIGTHRSMLVGGLLIAIGHLVLGVSGLGSMATSEMGMSTFIAGLALIVIGTGHFKPSVSVMVNQLYKDGDPRQPGAFGIFYMGINVGALLGTTFVALVGENMGWHYGFTLAAIGMIAGLVTYTGFKAKYLAGIGMPPDGKGKVAPVFVATGLVLAAVVGYLFHKRYLVEVDEFLSQDKVSFTALGIGLLAAAVFTATQPKGDKGPVASIFIFMGFNFLFWLAFEQAATSISFFTKNKIDREAFGTMVPTGMFQNINPFTIIALSVPFAMLWSWIARKKVPAPQPVKIGIGLIFLGLGFVFMVIAGQQVRQEGTLAAMWLLFATYFLHTIGELFLSPTGLSYVSKAAPAKHKSLLMGVWFLSSFLAYTIGGKLAGHSDAETIKDQRFFFQDWGIDLGGGYANFFFLFVFLSVGGGVVCILLTPLLRKLMRNPND